MMNVLASRFKPVLQKRQGLALAAWGEAGIGKSHQVLNLLQTLGCHHLSLHATVPLSTFAQNLPKPKKLATWAGQTLAKAREDEGAKLDDVTAALGATLAGLAPFVLHLEDIHEASEERFSFIQELGKIASRSKGVGLVVTSRKEPLGPFTALKLEPLSKQETNTLLETELKATLPEEAKAFIYDKAAGNPLYTLEYLRFLTRQGFLWNDGRVWHWRKPKNDALPATVEALIEQLLSRAKTEPLHRHVLESKAFLPLHAGDELWSKIARVNQQELQAAATELARQGIFRESNFAHPLFREVTLNTLTSERKQNFARRAMNVLEREPAQAALFTEDANLEPEKTLTILKNAAAQTKDHNEVTAAKFLAKAITYTRGEERSSLTLEAATALQFHDVPLALTLIENVLREEPGSSEALYLGISFYARDAQGDKAEALFARLPEHERNSLKGTETLLEMSYLLDRHKHFLSLWEHHKDLHETLNPRLISRAIYVIDGQLRNHEAITLALKTLGRTDLTEKQKIALLNPLAIAYHHAGQYEKAEEVYNRLVATPQHLLAGKGLRIILHNRASSRRALGRYLEAKEDALENYRLASEAGDSFSVGKSLTQLGEIYTELGDYEKAETYLRDGLNLLGQRDLNFFVVDAEMATSLLYGSWASPHSGILALKHARTALALSKKSDYLPSRVHALFAAICAEAAFGNAATALDLARELEGPARGSGVPFWLYYTAWGKAKALAAGKQSEEASVLLQEAYERARHEVDKHKIGLELDRLNNDVESARQRMQWFEERGLFNGVNIAQRYFPKLAETKESLTPAKSNIRLEVLGTLQAKRDTLIPIRGRKRQELLALLLEARISGRSEVSRLTLFDTLYPDEDELKAGSSLKNLVHSLRDTLGENAVTTTNNGYVLGECTSDAELFLHSGDTSLWRGLYLEDLETEDSSVKDSLYLSLFEKVKALLEDNPLEAARVGSILVEAEPYKTDYLKMYLTALRLGKNHGKLARHYQEARARLLEVGERLPETWQDFLSSS
jgi:tetratricopeptide (TPR) repeat protein